MADFVEQTGNIFRSDCESIVITVNCEGVMGAGIALDAKLRWPALFGRYNSACASREIRIGHGVLVSAEEADAEINVVCFPTKDRWRNPSTIAYITAGLEDLRNMIAERRITSVAMPHLGCSNGGLRWSEVQPLIRRSLADIPGLRVELWRFQEEPDDPDFLRLRELFASGAADEPARRLALRSRQIDSLASALNLPNVRGLASLQSAPGVGEKTLTAVYHYLFPTRSDRERPEQTELPL